MNRPRKLLKIDQRKLFFLKYRFGLAKEGKDFCIPSSDACLGCTRCPNGR